MKAIETHYNGWYFRSRLEARWAIYFDAIGLKYEHEPEGYEIATGAWYLPDFYFPQLDCFGEVKHKILTHEEYYKCAGLPGPCLLLDGAPEAYKSYFATKSVFPENGEGYQSYISGDTFGRVMIEQSLRKGRLWFLFGEDASSYLCDEIAEAEAKSARFERGEIKTMSDEAKLDIKLAGIRNEIARVKRFMGAAP